MLRDLKITLVMKMENAFVTLTLLETSVINVMLDLLSSQLVTSVLLNILEKIAKVKDLSRVKAGFKSVPLHHYFEFPATLQHWLAQRFQNKIEDERL